MADVFAAVADPRRREMLAAMWPAEQSVGALVTRFRVSQPVVSQQLAVLRKAGLVTVRIDGPRRLYRANPDRLEDVRRFVEAFWDARLDRLADAVRSDPLRGATRDAADDDADSTAHRPDGPTSAAAPDSM